MFERLKKRRKENLKLIEDGIENSIEIQKKRMDNRKDIINNLIKSNANKKIVCPYISAENTDNNILELEKMPGDPHNDPFGWPAGTVRGMLAMWVTIGFLLITMLIFFILPLSVVMITEMWKILAAIVTIILGSYFYTRIKMGNIFK